MFVDASVMVAILTEEPDGADLATQLEVAGRKITNTLAVFETAAAIFRIKKTTIERAEAQVLAFVETAAIEVLNINQEDTSLALQAYGLYGRHRYPDNRRNKSLNLTDCYHYASAKAYRQPILTKDVGFAETEIPVCR
jgi:ribonuclease VapC